MDYVIDGALVVLALTLEAVLAIGVVLAVVCATLSGRGDN